MEIHVNREGGECLFGIGITRNVELGRDIHKWRINTALQTSRTSARSGLVLHKQPLHLITRINYDKDHSKITTIPISILTKCTGRS